MIISIFNCLESKNRLQSHPSIKKLPRFFFICKLTWIKLTHRICGNYGLLFVHLSKFNFGLSLYITACGQFYLKLNFNCSSHKFSTSMICIISQITVSQVRANRADSVGSNGRIQLRMAQMIGILCRSRLFSERPSPAHALWPFHQNAMILWRRSN